MSSSLPYADVDVAFRAADSVTSPLLTAESYLLTATSPKGE